MLGRTHALIGVSTLAAAHVASGVIQPHLIQGFPVGMALGVGAAILGALVPDIDANKSTIKSSLGLAGKIVSLGMKLSGVTHRGLTHYGITALAVMIFSIFIGRLFGCWDTGAAFGLGYLSHILADGMTRSGVPLLWPAKKNVHLLPPGFRIKTGSLDMLRNKLY